MNAGASRVPDRVHEVRSRLRFAGDNRIGLRERESSARWDFERWEQVLGRRESHAHGSGEMAGRLVVGGVRQGCRHKERDNLGVRHIFTARGARQNWMIEWWWGEVNERARARGHARLRAHEHGRMVCAHSMFF